MWQTIISKAQKQEELNGSEMVWFANFFTTVAALTDKEDFQKFASLNQKAIDGNWLVLDIQDYVRNNVLYLIKFIKAWNFQIDLDAIAEQHVVSFEESERAMAIDMTLNIESVELELLASMNQARFNHIMARRKAGLQAWEVVL